MHPIVNQGDKMTYLPTILFYLFAGGLLVSACGVITAKNPVKAALWLVLSFVFASLHWILMQAVFLGMLLLLIYIGAVMVLFLFVVMLLDIDVETIRAGFWRHLPFSFFIGVLTALSLILIFLNPQVDLSAGNHFQDLKSAHSVITKIGFLMYSKNYVIAVEMAAILLLLGMVSAIALVHREDQLPKHRILPGDQVKVNSKKGRIKVVKMAPEREDSDQWQQGSTHKEYDAIENKE